MSQEEKKFALALLLATLLHAAIFFGAQGWRPNVPPPPKQPRPFPIAYVVSQPRSPEAKVPSAEKMRTGKVMADKPSSAPEPSVPPEIPSTDLPPVPSKPSKAKNKVLQPAESMATSNESAIKKAVSSPVNIPMTMPLLRKTPKFQTRAPKKTKPQKSAKPYSTQASLPPQTSSLELMPSIKSLSEWERRQRYEARSAPKTEETLSLNTRNVRYVSYFTQLKQRVEQGWVYPSEAKKSRLSGDASLVFTIRRDGSLQSVKVLRSSGARILDESAIRAVKNAAPFTPFPKDWTLEKLHIRATFEYIRRKFSWKN